jgi:ABC-type transporter Mla MlaB component
MGSFQLDNGQPDRSVLSLSGAFALSDALTLKEAMESALGQCGGVLALRLEEVSEADLTFFQLLFALSAQARLDGKSVVLASSLPDSLVTKAEAIGFSRRDIEHVFQNEGVR